MEKLKQIIPSPFWEYTPLLVLTAGGIFVIKTFTFKIVSYISRKKVLNEFKKTPKDVVILHATTRGRTIPSPSPFVMKLETYLRMANIPYELDVKYPFGPTKKTPWITLNGEHIGDTQLIIEFLSKKFDKQLGKSYTAKERALGTMSRIMVDEHLYWAAFLWRYVYRDGVDIPTMFAYPPLRLALIRRRMRSLGKTVGFYQGIGRHSEKQVIEIAKNDLRVLSEFLGQKKFLLGDEPCEDDCSIFGLLSELFWSAPGIDNEFEKYADEELPNLRDYTVRMKEMFWPDWNSCLAPSK